MADHTVSRRGTDSSGRGIYASDYMWSWWLAVIDSLPFGDKVVITQSAWMTLNGGGASASAGYHDGGGCFDLRVWNLTQTETFALIRAIRRHGAAAWLRDMRHGGFSDPHIHLVLGTDYDIDDGAAYQWRNYIAGGDGMGGSDYHPRPVPLVTTPPEVDDMAEYGERILTAIKGLEERDKARNKAGRERDKKRHAAILALLDKLADDVADDATKAQVRRLRDAVDALAEPDDQEPV